MVHEDIDKAQRILEGRCVECGWKDAHNVSCSKNDMPIQLELNFMCITLDPTKV